ncbi:hypothetical protein H3H37_01255 [Duganella sp. LX20W]|uniref:Uncharacterized protein n=1 Tax=Rugamonas brunnea TaxID=2758569 RepID=A0A7W2ENC3_9BURK|nr:hypothetical protein [Rugamonas brunnea]MBA5635679.1 hypothetical protein [Rugamonas brunnea]
MQDLISFIKTIHGRSIEISSHLQQRFSLDSAKEPLGGFAAVGNQSILEFELLTHYKNIWSRNHEADQEKLKILRHENGERVMAVTKSAFILSMSALEFSAKQVVLTNPAKLRPMKGRVYLSKIIEESVAAGIILMEEERPWKGLIELRNTAIHNNGIADVTEAYVIPGAHDITFNSGVMVSESWNYFPRLQMWMIEAFGRWCEGYLR